MPKRNRTINPFAVLAVAGVFAVLSIGPCLAATKAPAVPAAKPDPFRPFIELDQEKALAFKKKAESKVLPVSPLQRAEIDQFRLLGIAGDERSRTAIVDDGKGKFYPLIVGTAIGMNQGRVAQILADRVIVEEATKERGKKKVKRIIMKLRRDEEERKP